MARLSHVARLSHAARMRHVARLRHVALGEQSLTGRVPRMSLAGARRRIPGPAAARLCARVVCVDGRGSECGECVCV